ncbi:MAG TPA: ATP-binding protein [Chitinophagaceae bacterium]|nr:ATP-binding protein [Chitinophagaceae bacterium]
MTVARPILLFFLAVCGCMATIAQTPGNSVYRADSMTSIHHLQPLVLVDSSSNISDETIINGSMDGKFRPATEYPKRLDQSLTYWLRFRITSETGIHNWWLALLSLDLDHTYTQHYYAQHEYMDVYQISDTGPALPAGRPAHHSRSGLFVPRSEKDAKRLPAINRVLFSIAPGNTQTVYLKIKNNLRAYAFQLPIVELRDPRIPFPVHEVTILLAVASGIMLILCILSFFFYLFVKDKAYLFFSCYLLFICVHYQVLNPEIPLIDWLMPEYPFLIVHLWTVLTMGSFIFFFLFGRSFIGLPRLLPKTDKLLRWFLFAWGFVTVSHIVVMSLTGLDLVTKAFFPLFIIALAFIVRMAFINTRLARIFVAGAIWLVVFTILGGLWNIGVVDLPFNPWQTGQYGQLIIYCFGLAYKVRLNEQARAEADHIRDLDEIKSRFFANISHEFRTPLTLIRGPLQQIEEQASAKAKHDATVSVSWHKISTMRRHTDRLLELVNQLLDLSRLDSGKMRLQVSKGEVIQTLRALAASFESMAERKQIHYHMHFPEQSQIAYYDRDKLEKIVTNLLGNAFKYTPEKGSVSLIVQTDEKRLRLSVEDSGPGIAKKELDKVFDRFYQAEGNEDKGTGIGLALVKELTDLYRGQISVSSDPGKGSRFRVSLPIDAASFKQEELIYASEADQDTEIVYINDNAGDVPAGWHVQLGADLPLLLIIEDNTDLRNLIIEIVQHEYRVIQATNGKEGYELAVREVPDIIISDVMMPLMDGFTLAEKIKKDECTSHIPIILLTAKASQSHRIAGLETGADDYLTKPFDYKELLARLRNLLNQRKLLRRKFAGELIVKPAEISVNSADENFLNKVMQAIETNMGEEDFGVEELSRAVAMSRSQLHRKLVALTGQSPSEILRNTRLLRAKELLQKKAGTPSEVAFRVGFSSHTYFSKCFKEEFGISPSEVD